MMRLGKVMTSLAMIAAIGIVWEVGWAAAAAQQSESKQATPAEGWANKLLAERFVATHSLIKPQPGESRWREVPWLTSLWEARQKAAAAGKPIVVFIGSGGAPLCQT